MLKGRYIMIEVFGITMTWEAFLINVGVFGVVFFLLIITHPYSNGVSEAKKRALIKKIYDDTFED